MKTLYIECNMGAAGDMLAAALLELLDDPDAFIGEMNALGLPGVTLTRQAVSKCGVMGTHLQMQVGGEEELPLHLPAGESHHPHEFPPHSHAHNTLSGIEALITGLALPQKVKQDAAGVYRLLAGAEAEVHGQPVGAVHFHEVGAMDAVADIVAVCLLMHKIAPARVVASPVNMGGGQVKCAHGILPVPGPAAALLLRGAPTYSGSIESELCTPTGAALLKYFAGEFGRQPLMAVEAIGYGMGKKDFPVANCVRAFLGEEQTPETALTDEVAELRCNLDDMTGEAIGFAGEVLFENGALDVFTQAIQMKKSRPGQMLCCLCRPEDADRLAALMLRHTTSFGVRVATARRLVLARGFETVSTPFGPARVKTGHGHGTQKAKPEYEDAARLARENNLPLGEVMREITRAAGAAKPGEAD